MEKLNLLQNIVEILDDALLWLPEPLRNDIEDKAPDEWRFAQDISFFVAVITLIKEVDLKEAILKIESVYDLSAFKGELFLLRARIEFLGSNYPEMLRCLECAEKLGAERALVIATLNELTSLLRSEALSCNESEGLSNEVRANKGSCSMPKNSEFLQTASEVSGSKVNLNKTLDGSSSNSASRCFDLGERRVFAEVVKSPCLGGVEVSVFAAAWHKQPEFDRVISDHYRNLIGQTVAVRPIYVIDGGRLPPPGMPFADFILVKEPLTIYESWAIACQYCRSPFVMNLNLDDRLNCDACELFSRHLDSNDALLVGGEWEITFDYESANEARTWSIPVNDEFQWHLEWPPKMIKGCRQVLGSGSGLRGTYGPATMWKSEITKGFDYPAYFASGEPIKSIGDSVFWGLVSRKGACERINMVVGRYLSSPDSQAEFRGTDEREVLRQNDVKVWSH